MKSQSILIVVFAMLYMIMPAEAFAQEGDVYVSIAGGVSIPLEEYAETDFNLESSGFARPGGNFTINFGYRLNEYLSLTGLLSGSVNRFDYVKLQDWLTENYQDTYPDTRWLVDSKNWGMGGLMAGFTGSLPLSTNKLYIEARALGGFTYVYSPALTITGIDNGVDEDMITRIDQYSAISWALDFGAGFRYNRKSKQYFTLFADYLIAHPYYKDVVIKPNDIGIDRADSFSQKINAVNITLGIGYIVN